MSFKDPQVKFNHFLNKTFLWALWMTAFFPVAGRIWAESLPASAVTEGGVPFYWVPESEGKADTSSFTVWAFSQCNPSDPADPQVLDLAPDIVPRAWAKWDRGGLAASDYNWAYPKACHAKGTTFIGGGTASVLFRDEATTQAQFDSMVSLDAQGEAYKNSIGSYRGSLASRVYREFLIRYCELQIDGGVDGLFFDEVNGGYTGSSWIGDGGFEDASVADFGHYLCVKHPGLTPDQWQEKFGILPEDHLDCARTGGQKGSGFDYRGYLKRNGWEKTPLNDGNPLAADWGHPSGSRPDPDEGTFTQTYPNLLYWQEVVLTLRTYPRKKYGREILITANGIYPFVDFQCVGLYDWNHDGPGGSEANYVPVKDRHLDGTVSLQDAFRNLKARSLRITHREVPVSLFLDWPGPNIQRYLNLSLKERQDYWRLYAAEAYANGLYYCFHLRTTTGEPTADQQGMMSFFKSYSAFYRSHVSLYHGAKDLSGVATVSAPNVTYNLVQLPDGRRVLHLINHNYSEGFQAQKNFSVSFPLDAASTPPKSVTVVSPDAPQDNPLKFSFESGFLKVNVPELNSYAALVVE